MAVCPNKSHPDWIQLESKVGLVEAYRIYNRLDYNIPDFAFATYEDVESYLRKLPWVSYKDGKAYVKAGKNPEEYGANKSLVDSKIVHINKAYHNLLSIGHEDISQELRESPYNWGRDKAAYIDISREALAKHYVVYEKGEKRDKIVESPTNLKEADPIPLRGNEGLYKKYNLLTNDGKIKTVPYNEKTQDWVRSLNQSPNYHFTLRQTPGGWKIFIVDPTEISPADTSREERDNFGRNWVDLVKDVLENRYEKPIKSRDIIRALYNHEYITEDSPFYEVAKQLKKVEFDVRLYRTYEEAIKDSPLSLNEQEEFLSREKKDRPYALHIGLNDEFENRIYLYVEDGISTAPPEYFVESILHEIIHAYTVNAYLNSPSFSSKIDKLFNESLELSNKDQLYGFHNSKEFMAEIFTNPEFINEIKSLEEKNPLKVMWQYILDWLMRNVFNQYKQEKKLRGLEIYEETIKTVEEIINYRNNIEERTQNLISDDYIRDQEEMVLDVHAAPTKEQREQIQKEIREEFSISKEKKTSLEEIYQSAIDSLETKAKIYKGGRSGSLYREGELNELISDMRKSAENIPEALKLFQDFIFDQTARIEAEYVAATLEPEGMGDEAFSVSQLQRWTNYISGFGAIDQLAELAEGIEIYYSSQPGAKEFTESLDEVVGKDIKGKPLTRRDKIKDTLAVFKTIKNAYKKRGIPLVAKFITPYVKHIEARYRDFYEREYNKLSEEEKEKIGLEEYLEREIGLTADEMAAMTEGAIIEQLKIASDDTGVLQRWLHGLPDSRDMVVAGMADVFMTTEISVRKQLIDLQKEMVDLLRNLEKASPKGTGTFGDIRDVYEFMLEKDKYGNYTGHVVGINSSEMWADQNRKVEEARNNGASFEDIQNIKRAWRRNNIDFDDVKFKKARSLFLLELVDERKITKSERNKISKLPTWGKIGEVITDDETIDRYEEWRRDANKLYSKPKEKWINPQWYSLVSSATGMSIEKAKKLSFDEQKQAVKDNKTNDPQIAFYNFINNKLDQYQKRIPFHNRIWNRLPGILKSKNERIASKDNTFQDVVSYTLGNTFSVMTDEDMRGTESVTNSEGKEVYFIPIYYKSDLRKKHESKFETFDSNKIKKIEEAYREQFESLPKEDRLRKFTISSFAKERWINDNAIKDQSFDLASIYFKFFSSAINYSEKKLIIHEMDMLKDFVENREYTVTDWKGKPKRDLQGKIVTKSGSKAELPKQLDALYKSLMFGMTEAESKKLFGKIDLGKLTNAINQFTALNLLGGNVVQGFANVGLGSTMQLIESFAGRHYNLKDLHKANLYYWGHIGSTLGDIGARHPKGIVNLIVQEFDVLNDYQGGEFRKSSRIRQLSTSSSIMFINHIGEHEMQTKVMLAMLSKIEARDSEGNKLGTMLEMAKVKDGKLVFEGKNGEKVANFKQERRNKIEKEARYVLSRMHGEYSKIGQPAAQRESLGRLGMMFRKFIVSGWDRRYASKYVNNRIGDYDEGSYVTLTKFLYNLGKEAKLFRFALASEDWRNLRSWERSNIRKTIIELGFMLTSIILANVILGMRESGDDDDETAETGGAGNESWLMSFLSYQALRYKAELLFFADVTESMKILRSPAAAMSMLENTIDLMDRLFYPVLSGGFEFERYERGPWKDKLKVSRTFTNYIPIYKQYYRMRDVGDLVSWLK